MLNFAYLKKVLGIVSPSHFLCDISGKFFWCYILLSDQISMHAWLPLLLGRLVNMCIAFVSQPGCAVINFEINLIFLIKLFYYINRKPRQKFNCFENKKGAMKSNFHHFQRAFTCQKLSQIWECTFNNLLIFVIKHVLMKFGWMDPFRNGINWLLYCSP